MFTTDQRLKLQALLEQTLGTEYVYFQPPASKLMNYPCIVYNRDSAQAQYADNKTYSSKKRYQVTIMDRDPDSGIPNQVAALPLCSFNRHFTSDGLHHDVYNLYF